MKYLCINEVLFPVILKNYFSTFQETLLKYSNNIPTNDKANYCRNVAKKRFMKYYDYIFAIDCRNFQKKISWIITIIFSQCYLPDYKLNFIILYGIFLKYSGNIASNDPMNH